MRRERRREGVYYDLCVKIFPSFRLLGFVPLFVSTCEDLVTVQINCTDFGQANFTKDIRILNFSEHAAVDEALNPVAILFCIYVMALVSSLLLGPQVSRGVGLA